MRLSAAEPNQFDIDWTDVVLLFGSASELHY
jgi:hypothetical protein